MKTDFDTLRAAGLYIVNCLTEDKIISYPQDKRADLIEGLATELGVSFSTDEDIKDQAIEMVEEKLGEDAITEDITETEMYNHARKEIIKSFNGETIAGLYLVESLNQIANRVRKFLLTTELIEDVYASDEELVDFLINRVRKFNYKKPIQQTH